MGERIRFILWRLSSCVVYGGYALLPISKINSVLAIGENGYHFMVILWLTLGLLI